MESPLAFRYNKISRNQPWLHQYGKRKMVQINDEDENKLVRRWNEMDREILVSIMMRLNWTQLLYSICCVCKAWLSAVLDLLFPPGNLLDLRPFVLIPGRDTRSRYRRKFCGLIDLELKRERATPYTKLFLPEISFTWPMYVRLAQRLPSVKSISFPMKLSFPLRDLVRYWKELEELNCFVSYVRFVSSRWSEICRLGISGAVRVRDASLIAGNFPRLTHLSLQHCCLLDNSLAIILEGKKKLIYLDTRHAFLRDQKDYAVAKDHYRRAKEWDDQVLSQTTGIVQLLTCGRRNCSFCTRYYS